MSYHLLNNNYLNTSPIILPDPFSIINNTNSNKNNLQQYPVDKFSFQTSKTFIVQQKLWLNSFKINDLNLVNTSAPKTVQKPKTSSLADQRKNYLQNNAILQENLIKTVKPMNFSYKKPCPGVNPESFKQLSFPFQQIKQTHPYKTAIHTDRIKESRNNILSIEQIRQIQKKQFDSKVVHKITSSSSRQKLKTSSSKDSKGSANIERKSMNLNGNTQRYNKYINDGLININIDLRKQIAGNIVAPNLNVRKFGQYSNHLTQSVPNHQRIGSDLTQISKQTNQKQNHLLQTDKCLIKDQIKQSRVQSSICKQSVPVSNSNIISKLKNRSKSNLSKYTQLKQSAQKETYPLDLCHNQPVEKSSKNLLFHTPQKFNQQVKQEQKQKIQRKIHALSYSSAKNKGQNNLQTEQFYQKLQISCQSNQKPFQSNQKHRQDRTINNEIISRENRGISINQSRRMQGSQTQRKLIIRNEEKQTFGFNYDQKIQRKPIRLTLQKRN